MCGIVGAVANRDIVPVLIEGLRRLEYRGYDSAGVAVLNGTAKLKRLRAVGKACRTHAFACWRISKCFGQECLTAHTARRRGCRLAGRLWRGQTIAWRRHDAAKRFLAR